MSKEVRRDQAKVLPHRVEGRVGPIFGEGTKRRHQADSLHSSSPSDLENAVATLGVFTRDHTTYAKFGDGFYFVASRLPENAGFETPLLGEGFFEIHFCLHGKLRLVGDWGEVVFEGPRLLFWYHPPGHDDVVEQTIGGPHGYAGASLYCDRRWLRTQALGGEQTINNVWDEYVSSPPSAPQFRVLPLPGDADGVLRGIFGQETEDSLNYLQLKGRAFELFAIAFDTHIKANEAELGSQLKSSEIHKVAAVREMIYSNFSKPPTIDEFARAVGINNSRLMECFKLQYGETIRGMVLRLRMEEARRLLLTTDLKVSSIAFQVGYGHHSSFSAAFSEYFGVSPRKLIDSQKNSSLEQ